MAKMHKLTVTNGYFPILLLAIFVSYVNGICEVSTDTYHCIDTTRISCAKWRDGNYDCPDYSDELNSPNCPPHSGFTTASTYQCTNNDTAQVTTTCAAYQDGNDDCGDNSEEYCKDNSGTFTCRNSTTTIPCSKYRDGKNDCGENSDEGYRYHCNEKPSGIMFKCTMTSVADFTASHCQDITYKNDNTAECPDKTDEELYVGDSCTGKPTAIDCNVFLVNGACVSGVCACNTGAMSVRTGSRCFNRVVDDPCSSTTDCSSSMSGLLCNTTTSMCYCDVPYYIDNSADFANQVVRDQYTYCRKRVIGEVCVSNTECSLIANGYCDMTNSSNQLCTCNSDYVVDKTDNGTCIPRAINDTCATTAQCNIGMTNAECNVFNVSGVNGSYCECNIGGYDNTAGDDCVVRAIGEACTSDSLCGLISNGTCDTSTGLCACKAQDGVIPWIQSYNGHSCSYGLGDLPCAGDTNCSLHFGNNAVCTNSTCWCNSTNYEVAYTSCSQFTIGTGGCGSNDCTHIANAECDATAFCQCLSGYTAATDGLSCTLSGASSTCNFACQYPWALALLIIGLLAVGIIIVILVIKKPWKKPKEKEDHTQNAGILATLLGWLTCACIKKSKDDKSSTTVTPYTNGGLSSYDDQNGKPIWTLRPKSGNPVMYDDMHLREPTDPEVDAFFAGGPPPTPPVTHPFADDRTKSGLRRVRFEGGTLAPTPESVKSPGEVNILVINRDEEQLLDSDLEDDEPKKEKKGKKDKKKKEKKDKKKKKGKK